MKYKNNEKAVVMITSKESVPPFGITRNFTDKEIEDTPELRAAIEKGYLTAYDGPTPQLPQANAVQAKWTLAKEAAEGQLVRRQVNGKVVEYIVADAVGVDGVSTSPDDIVASIDGQQSADTIQTGFDASTYISNAADARERDLIKESQEAEFNDEDLLADKEGDRAPMLDADEEIAKDVAQVLVKNPGRGSDLKTIETVVQETTSKALEEIEKATQSNPDDGEQVDGTTSNRVVEFLAKPFPAKKWDIAKESDKGFLEEVQKHTGSDNLRSLIKQRLNELG